MDEQTRQAARHWTLAQPVVSAFVHSVVRDVAARDDVLQEVAVAVLESFDRYDANRSFTGWALGVAQNQVRLYFRRCQRDRLVFDDATLLQLATSFESTSSEQLRHFDSLRGCLERLERRALELCRLRYDDGLKPAAIAERVGMSANAVAKALQRIRDRLRECIEKSSGLPERSLLRGSSPGGSS